MKKILIVEPLLEESILAYKQKWLNKSYFVDYMPEINQVDILKVIAEGDYDGLIVRNKVIDRNIIHAWRNVKSSSNLIIVRAGSNISTIDTNAAKELNITVQNTPGANSWAVAQYVISQFFMLANNFSQSVRAAHDVNYNIQQDKSLYASPTFVGDKLALIGTGAIGSKISIIAKNLGMNVSAYSPGLTKERALAIGAVYCSTVKEAVADANFISIQVPFTLNDTNNYPKTFGMIDKEVLSLVSDGAKLISVSRRDVINMSDLAQSLSQGKLSNISLDLLLSEINGLKNSHPSVFKEGNVITPLIACESHKADMEIAEQALQKVENFLNNIK